MNTNMRCIHLQEPNLMFGYRQCCEYTKDGLFTFGPLSDVPGLSTLRLGVVATKDGMARFERWAKEVRYGIKSDSDKPHRMNWPGFASIFNTRWPDVPMASVTVDDHRIHDSIRRPNRHEAVYECVSIYEDAINKYLQREDARPDVWYVVIPEDVYRLCRPEQRVPKEEQTTSRLAMSSKEAHKRLAGGTALLFDDWQRDAEATLEVEKYDVNFHNQLKARMLKHHAVLQIVRETTIAPGDFLREDGKLKRRVDDAATVAWNICTTTFFKAQGRPWQLTGVRPGVCYVGLVYKQLLKPRNDANACCGAQMFLNSGDGVVFKGVEGNWYKSDKKESHLSEESARELMTLVINAYKENHDNEVPKELFIHGRARFNDDEWRGFMSAVPPSTELSGIRIRRSNADKLYRANGQTPVLRGTALILSKRRALLWSLGYIPRLKTYPGWEVPSPLEVDICKGNPDIETVLKDVLGLTKLNYNSCIYADGMPVTLRFANAVGEILTAIPSEIPYKPLPFKFYI